MTEPLDIEAIRREVRSWTTEYGERIVYQLLDRIEELEEVAKWAPREMRAKDVPEGWEWAMSFAREGLNWEHEHANLYRVVLARPRNGWPIDGSLDFNAETVQAGIDALLAWADWQAQYGRWDDLGFEPVANAMEAARNLKAELQPPEPEQRYRVYWKNGHHENRSPRRLRDVAKEKGFAWLCTHSVSIHPLDENGRALAELTEDELAELLSES